MSIPEHEQGLGMEFALPGRQGGRPARPTGLPLQWKLFVVAELSYLTYHAHQTHFLFAHISPRHDRARAEPASHAGRTRGIAAPVTAGSGQSGSPTRHVGTDRRRTPAGSSRSAPKCRSRKVLRLAHSLGRWTS